MAQIEIDDDDCNIATLQPLGFWLGGGGVARAGDVRAKSKEETNELQCTV